ncbi:MAG: hypothetical protein KDA59_25050, partial [Planctomycetales bacterium]|nr:hypothetical protein [Planctomycetales bacterium]
MATVFKRGGKGNRGGYYYVSWFDHTGKRRTKCAKTTDKAAAERLAAKLETEAMERRSGLIDATAEAIGEQTRRSIESHLADYEAKLQAGKRDARHVRSTLKYVRDIANAAGWETVGDIEADGVNRFAQTLNDGGKSARTIQAHLRAIKSFARWLATHRKLAHDPLASVVPPNPKANRRRERRMLLPAEWPWLRYAAENGPERFKTTGAERLLLYSTAIQTGLRSGELRSLKRGRLYLDAEPPYVTCKAGNTKNAKDARQYIQRDLANALRNHAATKTPTAHVFAMPDESDVADMLRADLADARRAWLDAAK